jgi:hypothetical protein
MPTERVPNELPHVDLEQSPIKLALQQIDKGYALQLVNKTFQNYEAFRTQNHDNRWQTYDSLYFGWVPQRSWEGTTVPRAALSRSLVFEQVETLIPSVYNAIFATPDWFQVEPDSGVPVENARFVQDAMQWVLEHPKDDVYSNFRTELDLAIRDILLYGNGGIGLEWDVINKRPKISWVNIKDFYFDPGTSTPSVDEGRAVIHRRMMTIAELAEMRGKDPRLDIPENDVLYYLAQNISFTPSDQSKAIQEAARGVNFQPNTTDFPANPAARNVEVLVYYTKDKIIWTLGRKWVAYNERNPYGFIPYCFAPCFPVPGRFYARSIADIQQWNQRYIEALLNGRLDEISLALHPPRVQSRDAGLTPSQQRWRPGAIFTASNPRDMQLLQPQSNLTNVYTEIQYIEQAGEKASGVNAMTSGTPRAGNVNRTATGVSAQTGAAASRLGHIVTHVENYLIVPMLYKIYKMMRLHIEPWDSLLARTKDGADYRVSGMVFRQGMNFKMLASSRMLTKDRLMGIFPFLLQYLLNGQLLSQLQKGGKTIDTEEIFRMLQDATGVASVYELIRPMNPQEMQAMQQPDPATQMAQQQKQQELETRKEIAAKKNETQLQVAQISNQPEQPDPAEQQMMQQKLQSEQIMNQIRLQAKQQEAQIAVAKKRQEMQIKQQEAQLNMFKSSAESRQKLQATAQQDEQKLRSSEQKSIMDLITQQMKQREIQTRSESDKARKRAVKKTKGE